MPKAEAHFDVAALCEQVLEQDLGLFISTNNAGGFRRTVYAHTRKHPEHRIHIYADPLSVDRFFLLRSPPPAGDAEEPALPPPRPNVEQIAAEIAADFEFYDATTLGGPTNGEDES